MNEFQSERIVLKDERLVEFREALKDEISHIKKTGQSSITLSSGGQVGIRGDEYFYRFDVEYKPTMPDDTPCKLIVGKDFFDVTVIGQDDHTITVMTKNPLPDSIGSARLENGTTVLMERLIKCIEDNADKINNIGNSMLDKNHIARKVYLYNDLLYNENNNDEQNRAAQAAVTNDITYIWGPPGTGKTTVIGQIIEELYKRDRTVLIVSHTNNAVDGAIDKAVKIYNEENKYNSPNYPILRLGKPVKELDERTSLKTHVAELGKDLEAKKRDCEVQEQDLHNEIERIDLIFEKDKWYRENRLSEISKASSDLEQLKTSRQNIENKKQEILVKIDVAKKNFPKFDQFKELLAKRSIVESRYQSSVDEEQNIERAVEKLKSEATHASDEIKKHFKYTELLKKQNELLSIDFLRETLADTSYTRESTEKELADLKDEKISLEEKIIDFEKKNSVAKFVYGKNRFENDNNRFKKLGDKIEGLTIELKRISRIEHDLKSELEECLYIKSQMEFIQPTVTVEFWEQKNVQINESLTKEENRLKSLKKETFALKNHLNILKQQIEPGAVRYNEILKLEDDYEKIICDEKSLSEILSKKKKEFRRLTELEQIVINKFHRFETIEDNVNLIAELRKVHKRIGNELSVENMSALEDKKELYKDALIEIRKKLTEIKNKMMELEKQAVLNAKILGATLVKSYLDETLRSRTFDTVILDEASMASIPALWCASYLADKCLVIVGDFLQLPPIVLANTPMANKWLGEDIFLKSGMQEKKKNGVEPDNFIALNKQYRMESEIADIANMYYGTYGGLESNDNSKRRIEDREVFNSWFSRDKNFDNCINLIDTESLHAWVTGIPQGKGNSRLNFFSASVTVELAFSFIEERLKNPTPTKDPLVLIIAPYKPHIKRIEALIQLEYENRGCKQDLNYIKAGTIHSFQGNEGDIVIFDLVLDEPHWRANLFMTGEDINNDLKKMFNVAVTRAKFKLFVVGNFSYCQKRAKNNALADFLDKLLVEKKLIKRDAKELLPDIVYMKDTVLVSHETMNASKIICREDKFRDFFITDVQNFEKQLIIFSPFITESRLGDIIPYFKDAISTGKRIIVVTKDVSERGKRELYQYRQCEKLLENTGVKIVHKKGMHEKLTFVDENIVWTGSLNALSFTGLTGEIMTRINDKKSSDEYRNIMEIEHICDAVETGEQKCPVCSEEMLLKDGDKGNVYWACRNCDYKRSSKQQYPSDGILKCECGAPYKFFMKTQPRWVCTENSKHYQVVREADLKLPEMLALIPTKERKAVERYFGEKKKKMDKNKRGIPNKVNNQKETIQIEMDIK